MRAGFNLISMRKRQGRLVRGVALFFLLFTGVDLAFPQLCEGEEFAELPSAAQFPSFVAPGADGITDEALVVSFKEDSRPDQPRDGAPHEEDCFCCCAHVLLGLSITTEFHSAPVTVAFDRRRSEPLSPPLQSPYRPPRTV